MEKMIKKIIFILLFILSFNFVLGSIEDDFNRIDSSSLGVATNGNAWIIDSASSADYGISNNQFFHNETNSPSNANAFYRLQFTNSNPNRIDIINLETKKSNSGTIYPYIFTTNGVATGDKAIYTLLYRNTDNSFVWFDGATWKGISTPINLNVVYNISFRNINYTTHTYDIYINNVSKQIGATFSNNLDIINYIVIGYTDTIGNDLEGYIDCITTEGTSCIEEPTELNRTIEQIYSDVQIGTVTLTGTGYVTILSGSFNITQNNTNNYGSTTLQVESNESNLITCRTNLDNINGTEVTKTNVPNIIDSMNIFRSNVTLNSGQHNITVECKKTGSGQIEISRAVGIGHILKSRNNNTINYLNYQVSKNITSGSVFSNISSINFTTNNLKNELTKYLVIDWGLLEINNLGSGETVNTRINIYDDTNLIKQCDTFPQFNNISEQNSLGGTCFINVSENNIYTIIMEGTGTNTEYRYNLNIKEFDLSIDEIDSIELNLINMTQSNYSSVGTFNITNELEGGQLYIKASGNVKTNNGIPTTANFKLRITGDYIFEGSDIKHTALLTDSNAIFEGTVIVPKGNLQLDLLAYCDNNDCTINNGEVTAYMVEQSQFIENSFLVQVYNKWNGTQLLNFNVNTINAFFNTTNGNITIQTPLEFIDISVSSSNYITKEINNHITANNINVTLFQSILNLSVTEIHTNNFISNFSLETEQGIFNSNDSLLTIYPNFGEYFFNYTFNTYFNQSNISINITSPYNEFTLTNIYDTELNFFNQDNASSIFPSCLYNNFILSSPYQLTVQGFTNNFINCTLQGFVNYEDNLSTSPLPQNLSINMTQAQITINLFDRQTGDPLMNPVNVNILGLGNGTTTNGTLIFKDFNFVPGTYHVEASSSGYYTAEKDFVYTGITDTIIDLYLLNSTFEGSTTLVVPVIDEFFNIIEGADTRLLEYDPDIFGFKEVSSCFTNANGECKFLIEVATKTYIITTSKEIGGVIFTDQSSTSGEIFLPEISAGEEIPGQIFANNLVLKLSSTLPVPENIGLFIDVPENENATIVSKNDTDTVINIPISFTSQSGLSYTVCLELYRNTNGDLSEVISPICLTGASGILPISDITLNNDFDYEARVTYTVDGVKTIYKSYKYPNNKSFFEIILQSGFASQMIMIFWVALLSLSLYLRNIAIWCKGAWFLSVIQLTMFSSLLVASSSVIIILINIGVLYISKRQGDTT